MAFIPPEVYSKLEKTCGAFVDRYNREDLTKRELKDGWDFKVNIPSSVYLAQLLRPDVPNAIRWSLPPDDEDWDGALDVVLGLCGDQLLPYSWELDRARMTSQLETLFDCAEKTHDLYWTFFMPAGEKVPVESTRECFLHGKEMLRRLNKCPIWTRIGARVISSKCEAVVDIETDELLTYPHQPAVIAVPKGTTGAAIIALRQEAARLTKMKVARIDRFLERHHKYLIHHPICLKWRGCQLNEGNLVHLDAVGRLTREQALRLYKATRSVRFLSVARQPPILDLYAYLGNIRLTRGPKALVSLGRSFGMSQHVIDQLWEIELQRRSFEKAISRIKVYPMAVERIRAGFRLAIESYWAEIQKADGLIESCRPFYLNSAMAEATAPRPPDVSKAAWKADLRRIGRLVRRIDAVDLTILQDLPKSGFINCFPVYPNSMSTEENPLSEGGFLDKGQVAELLGVSLRTVDSRLREGRLSHYKIGRKVRISRKQFQAYLADSKVGRECRMTDMAQNGGAPDA